MQFLYVNFYLITIVGCIGYYGHQCVHKCNHGYYGFGCREKCSCVHCNNVNGSCCKSNRIDLSNRLKNYSTTDCFFQWGTTLFPYQYFPWITLKKWLQSYLQDYKRATGKQCKLIRVTKFTKLIEPCLLIITNSPLQVLYTNFD